MHMPMRPIVLAALIAGMLDILFAMILTLLNGREIDNMLRFVASGPFPAARDMGTSGVVLGLFVHFALMAVMAAAFMLTARRIPTLVDRPIQWGVLYGLATYVAMNLIVVPLRFPAAFPPAPLSVATQLFAHIFLVGLPIALVASRHFGRARLRPS
jgi:hypothetical protein